MGKKLVVEVDVELAASLMIRLRTCREDIRLEEMMVHLGQSTPRAVGRLEGTERTLEMVLELLAMPSDFKQAVWREVDRLDAEYAKERPSE